MRGTDMAKNYKDKYNAIIDSVEKCFRQQIYTGREILREAQKTVPLDDRQLITVFEFLTGISFREYIGKRRLGAVFSMKKRGNLCILIISWTANICLPGPSNIKKQSSNERAWNSIETSVPCMR